MKKYRVMVDGEEFEVSIEELEVENNSQTQVETSVEKVEKEETETTSDSTSDSSSETVAGEEIAAALPGTITSIEVAEGDEVSKGQVLFIHEAMKMENEITTPVSGTVNSIRITEGTDVETDQVLAIIG